MKLIFLYVVATFCIKFCRGQDTLIYCQKNSPWISSCYKFYKVNKKSGNGTFEKFMESDDGQKWYGIGKFSETKTKMIIYSFNLIRTLDNSVKDSVTIKGTSFVKHLDSLIQSKSNKSNKTVFVRQKIQLTK